MQLHKYGHRYLNKRIYLLLTVLNMNNVRRNRRVSENLICIKARQIIKLRDISIIGLLYVDVCSVKSHMHFYVD